MEIKDFVTVGLSLAAIAVSLLTLYLTNFYKPAEAMLLLLQRDYSPEIRVYGGEADPFSQDYVDVPFKTNVTYSISNTGKQALCVKSVEVLRGPGSRGNLKEAGEFPVLMSNHIDSFILKPGEINVVKISFENESPGIDLAKNPYRLLSMEIASSSGDRFQICHDITNLDNASSLHHPIWDGLGLGRSIRTDGFV